MWEVAFIFHRDDGSVLAWHEPTGRTDVALPDSAAHWEMLWRLRARLGGVAHSHPWEGAAAPSREDVTSWAGIEAGLGRRLVWVIVTFDDVGAWVYEGPHKHGYKRVDFEDSLLEPTAPFRIAVDALRWRSTRPPNGGA